MTQPTVSLNELLEKGADVDLLRQMIQFVAQRMMELDVEGLCGAGYDIKSLERTIAATVTGTACGRLEPVMLICASPSCAAVVTFPVFWNRAEPLKKPWPR
jgi:hypothetical protein